MAPKNKDRPIAGLPVASTTVDKGKGRAAENADYIDFLSFNETVQFVVEFFEVAFHTILYLRQVYPAHIFARAKKYDTPVWRARAPILQQYIGDAARAVGEQLATGTIKQMCLSIRNIATDKHLESFVFDFEFLGVSRLFFASTTEKDTKIEGSPSRAQLAMTLRGLLVKLNVTEGLLQDRKPDEVTFDIGVMMRDDMEIDPTATDRLNGRQPLWIPSQVDNEQMVAVPIRTANLGVVNMQMFVQELIDKPKKSVNSGRVVLDIEDLPLGRIDKGKKRSLP